METQREEVETEVDRGLVSFLVTITEIGLTVFFVVVILGFVQMLSNSVA